MKRTRVLLEIRQMRFADLYEGWQIGRLSQPEAAEALGVSDRTFRRFSRRFEEDGANGLLDRRLGQVSARVAPVDEVMALTSLYRERYADWTVKHFFTKPSIVARALIRGSRRACKPRESCCGRSGAARTGANASDDHCLE